MNRRRVAFFSALMLTGLSLGCGPMRGASAIREVQDTVRQRSGLEVSWGRQPTPDPTIQTRVQTLLENELTVDGAVEAALLSSRRLQATFEELEIARADMVQAGLPVNPKLAGEIRFPARPVRPFELTLTQTLLDLLQLPARRRLADATFEPAKLRAANDVLAFVAEVRAAYYSLQAAEQTVTMRRDVTETGRGAAELAIRQHEAGNISDLDLENEQALFEQTKLDLAQSEAVSLAARERLNGLMGLWGAQTTWRIIPALPELPPEEVNFERVEAAAVSQRLDLMVARQEIEVAARARPLARSRAIGDIDVGVHHEAEPEGTKSTGPALDIPIPLFNRGTAARARAEAVLRQSQQRYAALAVEIRSEVRSARNRVLAARSRAEYYRDVILPRRERIVTYSQQQYNYMLLGTLQLLLAKQNEIRARLDYIETLRDYWTGRTELERTVGGTLQAAKGATGAAEAAPTTDESGPTAAEPAREPVEPIPPPAGAGDPDPSLRRPLPGAEQRTVHRDGGSQ